MVRLLVVVTMASLVVMALAASRLVWLRSPAGWPTWRRAASAACAGFLTACPAAAVVALLWRWGEMERNAREEAWAYGFEAPGLGAGA